jgi:cytochrome c oxidase accessory protein FixG
MTKLPVLQPARVLKGSLREDGSRDAPQPADVHGRFTTFRKALFLVLIAIWAALPWIDVGGHPAVFLDAEKRAFYLFGATFNAQDLWLLFFLVTGTGFTLVYVTALVGRVWCGFACPQTVFLEAFYRRVERWIEGGREERIRRNKAPLTVEKAIRKIGKHTLYVLLSFVIAHIFLSYFVSAPGVLRMVRGSPQTHPEAFAWAMAMTILFYLDFGYFREQLCLIVCPYGRLQSALVDADTVTVGYDATRGEPRARGKTKRQGAGDCVDCKRCVVVCPTNIDIRNGLQVDCIACTQCIDACDEVMDKLGRPRGLIRYASTRSLAGGKTKIIRTRTVVYTVLYVIGGIVALLAMRRHDDFEANLLRLPGPPYVLEGDTIRDGLEVHVFNKTSSPRQFTIEPQPAQNIAFVVPMKTITVGPMQNVHVPVFATMPRSAYVRDVPIFIAVTPEGEKGKTMLGTFVGAR